MKGRKKNILLHIGTEKTGTTTLQLWLARNRATLKSDGFLYPVSPGEQNHIGLSVYAGEFKRVRDLCLSQRLPDNDAKASWSRDFAEKLHQEILDFEGPNVILSNEHCWSRLADEDSLGRLHDLLSPIAENFKILCYFRPQHELLWSGYSTRLKSGYTEPFVVPSKFVEKQFRYFEVVQHWARIFGRASLELKVYDRARLARGVLEREFGDFAGFSGPLREKLVEVSSQNVKLDARHQEFLRLFNRHVPFFADGGMNPLRGNIAQILEQRSSNREVLRPEGDLRRFYELFAESNTRLAREYFGLPSDHELFPGLALEEDAEPASKAGAATLTAEEAVEIAADLWTRLQRRLHVTEKK